MPAMTPPPRLHTHLRCVICREPLTVHQAVRGGLCARPQCHHDGLIRELAERRAKREAAVIVIATRHRDAVAARLRAALRKVPVALIPASARPATLLPAGRRRLFREHLAALLQRMTETHGAFSAPLPPDEQPDPAQFHAVPPSTNAACSTCRGHCCGWGGTHAFIDEATLQRFATAHPALDSKGMLRAYTSHMPKRSMKHSCVFHGEQGCSLPREMRSAICNTYRCKGLQQLQEVRAKQVLLIAIQDDVVVRSALLANGCITATFNP
jgi:hypothetical protein